MTTKGEDPRAAIRAMAKPAAHGDPLDISSLSPEDIKTLLLTFSAYQTELEAANARLEVLYNMSPTGYITLDEDGIVVEANQTISTMLGMDASKMIGKPFAKYLTKDSAQVFSSSMKTVLQQQSRDACLIQIAARHDLWFQTESVPLSIPSLDRQTLCTMLLDVTGSQKAKDLLVENEIISRMLAERTVLLQEVHHRVKNNLQILMSLISLQTDAMPEGKTVTELTAIRNRIRSISLVHERIYESKNLSEIKMEPYIATLAAEIAASYQGMDMRISITLDVNGTALGVDTAIPVGLLLTELVSNSFKHAFGPGQPGTLKIVMRSDDEKTRIVVEDTGKGLPDDFSVEGTSTMGMQVVCALVTQLHGQVRALSTGTGARFEVDFPAGKAPGAGSAKETGM
jgi:PAS domain S-box-containing protein